MLYMRMQKPNSSIRDRLLDPLRLAQLGAHWVYEKTLRHFYPQYWEITNIYHHGGTKCVLHLCLR